MLLAAQLWQAQPGFAQVIRPREILHTEDKRAIKFYDKAQESLIERDFARAQKYFEKAIDRDPTFPEAYHHYARLLTIAKHGPEIPKFEQKDPLPYYRKFIDLYGVSKKSIDAHIKTAELYLDVGNYKQALIVLQRIEGNSKDEDYRHVEAMMANCEFALESLKSPVPLENYRYLPEQTVNTFKAQYFPSITADAGLLAYTVVQESPGQRMNHEDIYISSFENGQWSKGEPISPVINTQDNEGTCSISGDGRSMVFTSCFNQNRFSDCNLYITYKVGEAWSKPRPLSKKINTRWWESQPSLSSDGRMLYFVSDRPDGLGGKDIWVTTLSESGEWSEPKNLGPTVNTNKEELSPFIHANGTTLYFSSNGHVGMGKHDLYYSEQNGFGSWTQPQNLGYPLNTHKDEVAIVVNPSSTKAYYTKDSLRNAKTHYSKIVEFDVPREMKPKHRSYFIRGTVRDSITENTLSAEVELIDTREERKITQVYSDSVDGRFLLSMPEGGSYAFYVDAAGYLFKSKHFDVQEGTSKDLSMDIHLMPIESGRVTRLDNIFFAFDKYDLLPESETELNKVVRFLRKNPEIRIEIGGHTDNKGSESYNQTLSEKRAKAVRDYLVRQDIAQNRVEYKGYGESQPLVRNNNEENRALNRRIEFKIL